MAESHHILVTLSILIRMFQMIARSPVRRIIEGIIYSPVELRGTIAYADFFIGSILFLSC